MDIDEVYGKIKKIVEWYKNIAIQYELIKYLKDREMCLLVKTTNPKYNTRMLKCHSIQHLQYILFQMMRIETKGADYTIYYSLAKYKNGIPNQEPELTNRNNKDWIINHHKHIEGFDYMLDIDAPDFETMDIAHKDAITIKKLFDYLVVPYQLVYSGCGFHFIIPSEKFTLKKSYNPADEDNIYKNHLRISKILSDRYSELIDLSIYESRRVCKVPYSPTAYNDKVLVSKPFLSHEEFINFKYTDMVIDGLNPNDFKCRGTTIFNELSDTARLIDWVNSTSYDKNDIDLELLHISNDYDYAIGNNIIKR